jgi:putative heme iron utilization protein
VDSDTRQRLLQLLRTHATAALATLHNGEPAISMVPVALAPDGLLIHVSELATHTRDMRAHSRVSLLLMDEAGDLPQARPRVSIAGRSEFIGKDTVDYEAARDRYLARFAQAQMTFGLGDFSLVRIAPLSARFVAGFAQAHALGEPAIAEILREAAAPVASG